MEKTDEQEKATNFALKYLEHLIEKELEAECGGDEDKEMKASARRIAEGKVKGRVFAGMDSRSAEWPVKIRDFLSANGLSPRDLDQVLVGQGPGSFAGIRAALAFAQGIALGNPDGATKVVGLPSTYALTRDGARTAVVGDARRDRFWVVVYDGVECVRDFALVAKDELANAVPEHWAVVTPDGARIEPLPLYLQPAVRPPA